MIGAGDQVGFFLCSGEMGPFQTSVAKCWDAGFCGSWGVGGV